MTATPAREAKPAAGSKPRALLFPGRKSPLQVCHGALFQIHGEGERGMDAKSNATAADGGATGLG